MKSMPSSVQQAAAGDHLQGAIQNGNHQTGKIGKAGKSSVLKSAGLEGDMLVLWGFKEQIVLGVDF